MKDISLYEKIPPLENFFSVKFSRVNKEYTFLRPHWHEHIELLFFSSAECDVICDGTVIPVRSGDLVIVNQNQIHTIDCPRPLDFFYVILYPSFFSDVNLENVRFNNLVKNDAFVKSCIADMQKNSSLSDAASNMRIKSTAYSLMAYLIENFTVTPLSKDEYSQHISRLERLNIALTHISEHYHEKISTANLAKMCFFSESHFCYFFKNAVGKSAMNYINELRIDRAAVLLKNTDESIRKISNDVGFPDENYFSRVFRKYKGMSPRSFRYDG